MSKRLFVDMDGTLARFHDEVNYLERMWEPGFFLGLQPFEAMVEAIRMLSARPDVDVYILSSVIPNASRCKAEKNAWLDKYLPEIDAAHRIFPATGTPSWKALTCSMRLRDLMAPKHDMAPGGVTARDYLLDDYNKSLREWKAAGGKTIKCHNNINQRGLGAYGGARGELWEGAMAHVSDRPDLIAAEIARHMDEPFDLQRVAQAYGIKIGYGKRIDAEHAALESPNMLYEASRSDGSKLWYTYNQRNEYRDGYEMRFTNPLNAIRSISDPSFLEMPLMMEGELRRLTRLELFTRAVNLDLKHDFGMCGELPLSYVLEWNELRDKVEERLKEMAERKPVIGRVSFANGEKIEYTNPKAYIKCVEEELPYRATSGFQFETLTDDPQTRKAIDDIVYDHYGEKNPRPLEDYTKNRPAQDTRRQAQSGDTPRAEKEKAVATPTDRPSVKAKLENSKKAAPKRKPKHHDYGAR